MKIYRFSAKMAEVGKRPPQGRPFSATSAADAALGLRPRRALSSDQMSPAWRKPSRLGNDSSLNGNYPLNFVSHGKGAVHVFAFHPISPHSCLGSFSPIRRSGVPGKPAFGFLGWGVARFRRSAEGRNPFGELLTGGCQLLVVKDLPTSPPEGIQAVYRICHCESMAK